MARLRPAVLAVLACLVLPASAAAAPPAPSGTAPAVTGTARDGQTLSSPNGSWTGTAPITYTRRWQRCDAAGEACAALDASGATYLLGGTDVGATLRVLVTATNAEGTATRWSSPSSVVGPRRPPVLRDAPAVTGSARDGQTLTTTNGTWDGVTPLTFARRWLRCDAAGEACAPLTATGTTLVLGAADVGATIRVEVTATNADGAATARSAPGPVVAPAPPAVTTAPTVTGAAREGQLLSAGTGRWTGTPAVAFAHRWLRCAADGSACAPIAGATSATHRLTAADVGATLRAEVTASNVAGSAAIVTPPTAVVGRGAPVAVAAPEVAGPLPRDGQTYEATLGGWAGTEPFVHERQWLRCSSSGASCAPISGEVEREYRVRPADVGQTLRQRVTTTNAHGTATAQSEPTPIIGPAPPVSEAPPVVTGTARDGELLTTTTGTWSGTGPITHAYAWQRCDPRSGACAEVPGATAATYRLTSADVGLRVRARVGAQSPGGGAARTSAETAEVDAAPPVARTPPSIAGPVTEGGTLTTSTGTWGGTVPLDHEVRWLRCDERGEACADDPAGGAGGLELGPEHVGHTLRTVVTATNGAGTATVTSPATAVVTTAPPANVVAPAVSGDELRDGATLTATGGAWTGSRPLALSYQWQRCRPGSDACTDVPGAVDPALVLTTADVGLQLRVVVVAANAAGAGRQASTRTGTIRTDPPVVLEPPAVEGEAEDEHVLTAREGRWTGLVPQTTAFRWWRCDAAGEHCGEVAGAAGRELTLTPRDVGLTVRVQALRTNAGGTTAVLSAPTPVVRPTAPRALAPPAIRGPLGVGRTLHADPGRWSGTPALAHAYRWQRCAPGGGDCADVPGATGATHALTAADAGRALRVVVATANVAGDADAVSAPTGEVLDDPPVSTGAPRIEADGLVAQGAVLRAGDGSWAGDRPMTVTRQWRRCDAQGRVCADVAGATGVEHVLRREDVGGRMVLVVSAENAVAAATRASEPSAVVLPEPPAAAAAPVVTVAGGGPLRDGARLTATTGRWTGAAPITYATSWVRCDAAGERCGTIDGATGTSYVLGPGDVGARVRARVRATNAAASAERDSDATAPVAAAPPAAAGKPAVAALDGATRVGARLRAGLGTFTGTAPVRVAVQWQRCAAKGTGVCEDLPGRTGPELVLEEADAGRRLRVVVTAENAAGRVAVESAPSDVVAPVAPSVLAAPAVVGAARDGAELRATGGAFAGTGPFALTHQWERCPGRDGAGCARIAGAVGATYTPGAKDVGAFVRVAVTAANAAGKATAASGPVGAVVPVAPAVLAAPTAALGATPRVGAVVTAVPGRWAGTAPVDTTLRWQRCDRRGRRCRDVRGAEGATYTLTRRDVRRGRLVRPLRVVVTATNLAGRHAAASALVRGAEPVATAPVVAPAVGAVRLLESGRVTIALRCPAGTPGGCGAASGRVTVVGATRDVRAPALAAGRTRTLALTLGPRTRARLGRRGRATVRVRMTAPALAERVVTVTVPPRLRR